MPNAISTIFAVLLLIVGVIYVPVYQTYQKQDDIAYQQAYLVTNEFVGNVRTKGYITPQMVEEYESALEISTYMYKTEFVHKKKVYTPIYTNPKVQSSFTGEYVVNYEEYYKPQIKPILFNEGQGVSKKDRKYYLSEGDFFKVSVENINRTKTSMLYNFFTNGDEDISRIMVSAGGMVMNEDY